MAYPKGTPRPRSAPRKTHPAIDFLRQRRFELGLTQEALAEKIGKRTDSVYKWEAGWKEPNFDSLKAWTKGLGLKIEFSEAD